MKQNERLLVYAVTGFLAIILVIAVVFGRDPNSGNPAFAGQKPTTGTASLGDVLAGKDGSGKDGPGRDGSGRDGPVGRDGAGEIGTGGERSGGVAGLPAPAAVTPEQPLNAVSKTVLAADFVAQKLGPSERDRTVRLVRARGGDSLESLVRRWCGARDPYLDEALSLNETIRVLKAGQQVAVPWVDDEVLKAALEADEAAAAAVAVANRPRTLLSDTLGQPTRTGAGDETKGAPAKGGPSFAQPGTSSERPTAGSAPVAGGTTYTVKAGDSLWLIASRAYGRKNADRMIGEIRAANPGVDESLRPGQKLVMPAAK